MMSKMSNTNTACIVSIFPKTFPRMTNPNSHQTPYTNRNCYYTVPIRERNSENNILDCLAN